MNAQITNLVFSLGAMQVARKIPTDDPEILFYLRIAYVAVQILTIGGYFYMSYKVKAKNDTTVLKYVEPPKPMSGAEGEVVTTTVRDYDLMEIGKLSKGVYIGCAMMLFLHLYMKYTQPLFIQSVMTLKGLVESKPAKLHLFNSPAVGDLKRPFAAPPSMFAGLAPAAPAAEESKGAIKEDKKTK